jgi:hypothetical protein
LRNRSRNSASKLTQASSSITYVSNSPASTGQFVFGWSHLQRLLASRCSRTVFLLDAILPHLKQMARCEKALRQAVKIKERAMFSAQQRAGVTLPKETRKSLFR